MHKNLGTREVTSLTSGSACWASMRRRRLLSTSVNVVHHSTRMHNSTRWTYDYEQNTLMHTHKNNKLTEQNARIMAPNLSHPYASIKINPSSRVLSPIRKCIQFCTLCDIPKCYGSTRQKCIIIIVIVNIIILTLRLN